jgi:hemerythrin
MSLITWNDQLSVNIREIDNQHQSLISLINQLHESMKMGKANSVIGPILSRLEKYTVFHFGTEEKYFQQFGYPDTPQHKRAHEALTQKVKDLNANFSKGALALSIDTMNLLKGWLTDHILGTDKKYSEFFRSKGLN